MDLRNVDQATEELKGLNYDLIAGGPPYQDFSSAGKREEGTHANLTEAFAEIVARCKPRFVLMENIPRVRSSNAYHHAKALLGSEAIPSTRKFSMPICAMFHKSENAFSCLDGLDGRMPLSN